jgi:hypothetical protein
MKSSWTRYREAFSQKMMELANLCFVGLIFGQIFPLSRESNYSVGLAFLGVIVWAILHYVAFMVAIKGGDDR